MNPFLQTLKNLGPVRLAAMAGVTVALIAFFIFLTTRLSTSPMTVLYRDLDAGDAGAISAKLDQVKVPYQVSSSGVLMVPTDQVGKIRMTLAQDGLPRGGNMGYEIFDQKSGFGTTSFVQNINHLRALEGEIARTISTLGPVHKARVHLVLPQRELFSRAQQNATASIFLQMRAGGQLTREQVGSIQFLVSAAVPQLSPTQISIVDDKGNLLLRAAGSDGEAAAIGNHDEMRAAYEQAQARKIEELLSKSLGYGKVRAQVSAELDFDRVTTNSEIYDPESQVIRSTQTVTEDNQSREAQNQAVSVSSALPPAINAQTTGTASPSAAAGSTSNRSEETVNYEINKTIRSHISESGQVRRLSAAILVDGLTTTGADGKSSYTPRTEQEMEQIKALVRSAINYNPARGDTVEVVNMRFADSEAAAPMEDEEKLFGFPKADLFRLAETLVLGLVGLLMILLVVRPLIRRILDSVPAGGGGEDGMAQLTGGGGQGRLAPPSSGLSRQLAAEEAEGDAEMEQMIDISRVEGRVRASSLRKVGEIVEKHPEEAVSILRNWIYQQNG
jgi:flagellar M-ring protein FliF